MELKRRAVWSAMLVTLVVSLIGTYVERGEAAADDGGLKVKITSTIGCNATMNGACNEEEFLMDSEVNRRLLAGSAYDPFKGLQRPPICDATRYGSCIGHQLHGVKNKPCSMTQRSCRGPEY